MVNKILSWARANRLTAALLVGVLVIVIGGGVVVTKLLSAPKGPLPDLPEIEITFDPEGPYAVLTPRNDGHALTVSLKRISGYDQFSYSIAYTDDQGIPRGAGDESTWIPLNGKSEFNQEILFGTCSKNVCKYDNGVENGTLVLHIKKANQPYKMSTLWHLQKPEVALGVLTSGDGHFTYDLKLSKAQLAGDTSSLSLPSFTLIHELTGAPKLPNNKKAEGKVYIVNTPDAKALPQGDVVIESADKPSQNAKINLYSEKDNAWKELETSASGSSTLKATTQTGGIFAILSSK